MTKLLSFLSLLTVATGCADCVPVNLTPDERAWVSAYQPGQQLTFRSNRGATNVFTAHPLREWLENQDCNVLEAGKYQPIRTTLGLTSAANYGGENGTSFSLVAHKITPDYPARFTFTLGGLLGQDLAAPGQPNSPLAPQPLTLADGRRFAAAYLLRNGQGKIIYLGSSQLRAAWWDQHAGLLRYELASGEVFDLVAN